MTRDRNAVKAGLFIVITFVAAVAAVVLIRGSGSGPMQARTVSFSLADDLDGLSVGDDVRIGGAKVGTVHDIQLVDLDSTPRILVKFSLPTQYVLRDHAEISVQTALTGPPSLNITNLGHGTPLPPTTELAGMPDAKQVLIATLRRAAPHVEAIAANFETQTLPKINQTVDSANTLVRHVDSKIDPVVKEYDSVATKAADVMGEARDLVGDAKPDFRGTMKNLNLATASIREKLPPLMDKITGIIDKADGAVTSAKAALVDIEKASANLRDATGSARSLLTENRSRLDSMVKSLKTTSDNLKAASVEVRHSPWRVLYKPTPDEMGNLNIYDSARQFAEGAASMSDAAMALRDAMHDPNVDKASLQKLITHLDESFKSFREAEGKLWTSVKQ